MSDAILQFEIDRSRWTNKDPDVFLTRPAMLEKLVESVARDVVARGGTMVLVASQSTITIVQRKSADLPEDDIQGGKDA